MHWFSSQEKLASAREPSCLKVLDTLRAVVSELVPDCGNLRTPGTTACRFRGLQARRALLPAPVSDGERACWPWRSESHADLDIAA
jgi:hypothetical protein